MSALVQAARGTPYMQALLYISHEHLIPLVIPAPCLADALAGLDDPQQQARLFDLVRSPIAKVAQFGATEATGTGLMRAGARPARASTSCAYAAYLAADRGWPVVSAAGPDPGHEPQCGDRAAALTTVPDGPAPSPLDAGP